MVPLSPPTCANVVINGAILEDNILMVKVEGSSDSVAANRYSFGSVRIRVKGSKVVLDSVIHKASVGTGMHTTERHWSLYFTGRVVNVTAVRVTSAPAGGAVVGAGVGASVVGARVPAALYGPHVIVTEPCGEVSW